MIHAAKVRRTKKFADTVKVMPADKYKYVKNKDAWFCGKFDADTDKDMVPDPNMKITYQEFGSSVTFVDLERPLVVDDGFNLEAGNTYQIYLSYYIGSSGVDRGSSTVK